MRLEALTIPLLLLSACGTTTQGTQFQGPNQLMGQEIDQRVDQIPFQHREELLQNLLWLAQGGEQCLPALLKGLKHENPKVRSSCAWVLGRVHDRRTIPDLQVAVKDEQETVRLEVARTLLLMGDLNYCPVLIEGLDSDKKEVRFLAHEALRSTTGRDFGFDHLSEDATARHTAVLGWRQWWGDYSGDTFFAQRYAQQHGLQATQPQTGIPSAPMGEGGTQRQPDPTPMPVPQGNDTPQGSETPAPTPVPRTNR